MPTRILRRNLSMKICAWQAQSPTSDGPHLRSRRPRAAAAEPRVAETIEWVQQALRLALGAADADERDEEDAAPPTRPILASRRRRPTEQSERRRRAVVTQEDSFFARFGEVSLPSFDTLPSRSRVVDALLAGVASLDLSRRWARSSRSSPASSWSRRCSRRASSSSRRRRRRRRASSRARLLRDALRHRAHAALQSRLGRDGAGLRRGVAPDVVQGDLVDLSAGVGAVPADEWWAERRLLRIRRNPLLAMRVLPGALEPASRARARARRLRRRGSARWAASLRRSSKLPSTLTSTKPALST